MTPKAWGTTQCLLRTDTVEVHHIKVVPNGYCSVHRHRKLNTFLIVDGEILIRLFEPDHMVFLSAGQEYTVPSMRWHQFQAKTAVEAIEVYVPAPLDPEDIERRSEGGVA